MPKQKTNKSVAKRVKITAKGKLVRNRPGRRHLQAAKTSKTRRQLRKQRLVSDGMTKKFLDCIAK
ncbi:50S ribosomal protein L35 [Candidatus Uabimicrobium sp. HlEnr_7]|uniref:50S ribosomal protein L35 n=1 Tax=Candidatus Uabimicrobium helgolandensis TaxID=3095367 RepID=UPI003556E736